MNRPGAARNDVSSKIRVAHLLHTIAYGGIETAILNWLKAIDHSRFEVHLFCFANPHHTEAPFVDAASQAGFAVHRIPWSRSKPILRAARVMAGHMNRLGIQILHCHNTYAQIVTIATARLTGVKTITTLYVWGKFGWKRAVLQWADRFSLRFLDRVSAHCQTTFEETVKRGYPAERLCLLTCGFTDHPVELTPEERQRGRALLGAKQDDFVLVYVARFWPEKAHDVLLRAFRIILDQQPNARLWLAGVGPLEAKTQELCDQYQLSGATQFLGFRKDIPELLALADMQVHPSDMEGVPLAVCAGMAAGLPIVASRVGGLPEILRPDLSAVLVEPRQPEQLADAVLRLIADPGKRRALGTEARRFIEEEYSLSAAVSKVEAVYEEMLKLDGGQSRSTSFS